MSISVWTACGDSIVRAFDAKSGAIKRSFVGHEAAVNCMTLTGGKLYTGSSDGTLRIWDAKDVSDEMVDDGPPPPVPEGHQGDDEEIIETGAAEVPEQVEPEPEEVEGEAVVEDIETGNGDDETPEENPAEDGDADAVEEDMDAGNGDEDEPKEDDVAENPDEAG